MTITISQPDYRPVPVHDGDDRFVSLAAELGAEFAPRAAVHDRENTFVYENFERMRASGYLRLAVPEELGGLGASMRQVCFAQAELAKHCASTALAVNMHLYLTTANAAVWRRGNPAPEKMLRRVASEGIILMTSGASDGIYPSATAEKVEGGFRVSGSKMFCSQAPVADIFITMAVHDDPQEGVVVLLLAIPAVSEGYEIVENWDTLGMRATSSHEVKLTNVFVPDAMVVGRRPWGRVDPILRNALVHFAPLVSSVYYGVAAGARDEAVRMLQQRPARNGNRLNDDIMTQRQVGLMDTKLRTAWWSLLGALEELGSDYQPDDRALEPVVIAKSHVITSAIEIVDLAMEVAGGISYFRRSPLERAYRDVRAGRYHPLTPEKTLLYAGRSTLALPVDQIW